MADKKEPKKRGPGRPKGSKNKNVKIKNKVVHIGPKLDDTIEYEEINTKGRDSKGRFIKGNQCAALKDKVAGLPAAFSAAVRPEEAASYIKQILNHPRASLDLKWRILEKWLAYTYGTPVKQVITENTTEVRQLDLDDKMKDLIKNLDKAVNE